MKMGEKKVEEMEEDIRNILDSHGSQCFAVED